MQIFNLTTVSSNELDRFASKILELKRVSFQYLEKVLKQIDENNPFVIPFWSLIIVTILGTLVIVIIVHTICYFT